MWRGISLANKCLLLFGGAVVLIVGIALTVPLFRMNALVDEGQLELSRQMISAWERQQIAQAGRLEPDRPAPPQGVELAGVSARLLGLAQARAEAAEDRFLSRALAEFLGDQLLGEYNQARWIGVTREYRYARAVRNAENPQELLGLILLDRRAYEATRMLAVNTAYLISAGFFVLGLAVLVFYVITHRLILGPVRALKETAERVREGDLSIRSDITTGDEFEELSDTFNDMLAELARSQDQLRSINRAMDLKLGELAQANSSLYQAARIKGEFVASVSHELRTPLNSIIGFAELLRDAARAELDAGDDSSRLSKRVRFIENILAAGKRLLEMINELLDMAKIEAGKSDLRIERVVLRDALEALMGLAWPLAERKGVQLRLDVPEDLPIIQTDVKKFQQVIFNFLSNAVKFTPGSSSRDGREGLVTLRAERLPAPPLAEAGSGERVRISVIDTGPGIPKEDQERLFQKFSQLDAGLTREHAGTGLGLAIAKEIAGLLQGEIQLVSEPGSGSMFSLILPVLLDPDAAAQSRLEARFRTALAGSRVWA